MCTGISLTLQLYRGYMKAGKIRLPYQCSDNQNSNPAALTHKSCNGGQSALL